MFCSHSLRVFIAALALISACAFGGGRSANASAAAAPEIALATVSAQMPGTISISGEAFTPGGPVYVALYDKWGTELYETRWIMAPATVYGPDGSQDPARGYVPGGVFDASFTRLCGATPLARAFDQSTNAWSNWLDIQPNC